MQIKLWKKTILANANRAAYKGYSYRLLENGFITNSGDLSKFNNRTDELASGILSAFGISANALVASTDQIDGAIKSGGTSRIRKMYLDPYHIRSMQEILAGATGSLTERWLDLLVRIAELKLLDLIQ